MSIHNLRCGVQLIKIAKRDKKNYFRKQCIQYAGSANNYMHVMVTYAVVAILRSNIRNLYCNVKGFVSPVTAASFLFQYGEFVNKANETGQGHRCLDNSIGDACQSAKMAPLLSSICSVLKLWLLPIRIKYNDYIIKW